MIVMLHVMLHVRVIHRFSFCKNYIVELILVKALQLLIEVMASTASPRPQINSLKEYLRSYMVERAFAVDRRVAVSKQDLRCFLLPVVPRGRHEGAMHMRKLLLKVIEQEVAGLRNILLHLFRQGDIPEHKTNNRSMQFFNCSAIKIRFWRRLN